MTAEEVIGRYLFVYHRLRHSVSASVAALWARHGGLTDENADAFVAAVLPLVHGAQTAAARLLSTYIQTVTRLELGSARPLVINTADLVALRGIPPEEVYRRPVIVARTAISEGLPFQEAIRRGGMRARQLVETDITLTQRAAVMLAVATDKRITGYRRVLTSTACAYCVKDAGRRYGELPMPIHVPCSCGVAPIFPTNDPGRRINQRLVPHLEDDVEVEVHRHGELGPVLTDADHSFATV